MALWKKTPKTCCGLPTPAVPANAVFGFAFSQAINSFRSFAGMAFLAMITNGWYPSSATGSKSFSTSY